MTYVTCPTMRYHPAVVAQKAATLQLLADGPLHPRPRQRREPQRARRRRRAGRRSRPRQEMLAEAIEIIRELHTGELVDLPRRVLRGRLRADLGPARRAGARSASRSPATRAIERFAPLADHLIAVEPDADLVDVVERASTARRGSATRRPGDRPDPDLLGPRRGHGGRAGARAVPLVRRRLEGERRPADARRASPGRPSSSAPRTSPSRSPAAPTSTRIVEAVSALLGGRLHRRRPRPDRRREPGASSSHEAAGPLLEKLRAAST